ncbi:MAG: hypothetical protein Q8R89_08530, partial [Desulfomicrobium sp.]|nr:hypothetical protein [Desulfomicrobium sp.]
MVQRHIDFLVDFSRALGTGRLRRKGDEKKRHDRKTHSTTGNKIHIILKKLNLQRFAQLKLK